MPKNIVNSFNSMLNRNDPDYDWSNEQVFSKQENKKLALERYMRNVMSAPEDLIYVYTHDNMVMSSDRTINFSVPSKLKIFITN